MKDLSWYCQNECAGRGGDTFRYGHSSECCEGWPIGPIKDHKEFLERLSNLKGETVEFSDVLITAEEGKEISYNENLDNQLRIQYQNYRNFPAIKPKENTPTLECMFLDKEGVGCTIHEIRPNVCRNYFCPALKKLKEENC